MTNFDLLEKQLYKYLETKEEDHLVDALIEMKPYLKNFSKKMSYKSKTVLTSEDDIYSIALERIYISLDKFKFYCPHCRMICLSYKSYVKHLKKKHNSNFIKPKIGIFEYLKYQIGVYTQNELREEESLKRKGEQNKVDLYTQESDVVMVNQAILELSSTSSFVDDLILKELMDESIKKLDEVSRIILQLRMLDYKNKEIAEILYNKGFYTTFDSANSSVSNILRNKISKHFEWIKERKFAF